MSAGIRQREVFRAVEYKAADATGLRWVLNWIYSLSRAAIPILILLSAPVCAQQQQSPRVFLINARKLAETKQRIQQGDKTFDAALAKLERDARKALEQSPVSVTTKAVAPPAATSMTT